MGMIESRYMDPKELLQMPPTQVSLAHWILKDESVSRHNVILGCIAQMFHRPHNPLVRWSGHSVLKIGKTVNYTPSTTLMFHIATLYVEGVPIMENSYDEMYTVNAGGTVCLSGVQLAFDQLGTVVGVDSEKPG